MKNAINPLTEDNYKQLLLGVAKAREAKVHFENLMHIGVPDLQDDVRRVDDTIAAAVRIVELYFPDRIKEFVS